MPKLRNKLTGVVVDVDDATATWLGPNYERVETATAEKPKPAPRRKPTTRKK